MPVSIQGLYEVITEAADVITPDSVRLRSSEKQK